MPEKEDSLLTTQCSGKLSEFHPLDGGKCGRILTGERSPATAGGLLLREVEKRTGIIRQFADCFRDHRQAERIEHRVEELVAQRVYGLALGYEDLNDHDELRRDPLLGVLAEKADPTGESRARERDQGKALAGKSTLNRLELTGAEVGEKERYKKIVLDFAAVDRLLGELFLESHAQAPPQIILDLDSTDDPLHGNQEGRFFHGYYGHYCYLPLYIFCGEHLLCARLRPANIDGAAGSVEELARLVQQIRQAWPEVRIIVRGDSGFCREELMAWCEATPGGLCVGAGEERALAGGDRGGAGAGGPAISTDGPGGAGVPGVQLSNAGELVAGAAGGGQGRTSGEGRQPAVCGDLAAGGSWEARRLYEELYCARGEMENRIKEQLMLFADRTSTAWMRSNQIRLYFSSMAYVLMQALRRLGLQGTRVGPGAGDDDSA